jgi:HAE1 family hydrophobic/amphiphilic exporter-1
MFFAAMVLLGLVSLVRLPMQILPDISPPYGAVRCIVREEMSQDEVERKVIQPIEGEIAQLPNVKNISYFGRYHFHFFPIEFEFGTNVKYKIVDLQDRLNRFKQGFERNAIELTAFAFDTAWVNKDFMDLVLKGPRDDLFIERIDSERIRQKLQDINGVAEAEIWGGRERTVDVTVFQDRLREFGVPFWQVMNRVGVFASEPVFLGDIDEGPNKYFVRLDGQFSNPNEISDVVVRQEGNIAVRHLGEVEELFRSRRWMGRMDGKPALRISLKKEALENPIELSLRTKEVIDAINETMEEGYELGVVWEQATEISDILVQLSKLGLMGIVLSMLVLYLFIRNVRISLVVCIVIPICIVATFNCMYFADMTINIISLIGLVIGVGCLIDSSIVVLENIFRHHERGKDAYQAAIIGSREVGMAVFALTLTNVLVFLPIVFIEGQIRMVFTEGALAIVFPMAISMLVALTLVPMATSRVFYFADEGRKLRLQGLMAEGLTKEEANAVLAQPHPVVARLKGWFAYVPHPRMATLRRRYGTVLKSCLRHRIRFLLGIILLILYTYYYTVSEIDRDVLKEPTDVNSFDLYLFMPNGTKQDYTLQAVTRIEDVLNEKIPEADHINTWVSDDFARFRIDLVKISERERESPTIKEELRTWMETFPEGELSFNWSRTRGESQPPVMDTGQRGSIEIRGPEYEQLYTIGESFSEYLKQQIPDVRDAEIQTERGAFEVVFKLDRDTASYLQIDANQVARSIQGAQRRSDYSTIQMKKGDSEIAIMFALFENPEQFNENKNQDDVQGISFEELKQVPVFSPLLNSTVSLDELGTFDVSRGMGSVQRENRERISKIMFDTAPTAKFTEVEENIKKLIETYPTPAGYRLSMGGKSEQVSEEMEAFKVMVILAVILVYMSIAALFESFSEPLIIMFAIPLAIMGIVWALILTDTQFDALAVMGCVFLIGMLPNSSILLIHFSGYLRREKNYPRERAVMVSGYTRLRPIFMTVLTTVLGLIPMAIKWRGDDQWVPFAVTVIGGLSSSTILTLLIVPGFYFIVEDITTLFKRVTVWVGSWRWLFVFWSRKKRRCLREELTAYRVRPPREEPLRIQIDHLTRIYPVPRLDRFSALLMQGWRRTQRGPVLGFVPQAVSMERVPVTRARKKALDMISIEIGQGLFGLLGPNGAGKTTLLRLLAGIDQPSRGYLSICGYDMKTESRKAQQLIGYLPQNFGVYSHMTAWQYLDYFALLKGMKNRSERHAAIHRALEMVNLSQEIHTPVSQFSGGMMRRIGLAQIFVQPPKVLIIDEPTVGLDPMERVRFRNLLAQLSRDRVVILSTHIVEDVAHSCKQVALMNEGRIITAGTPEQLVAQAAGKVWELGVEDGEAWRHYRQTCLVAAQMQTEDHIRMRIVSESAPHSEAQSVAPTLEDAYLYFTRGISLKKEEQEAIQ